jgi:SAM-dependent methyltransferase
MSAQARGWAGEVDGYEAYYVPRFAPWVAAATEAVAGAELPDGPVLVPCCGTFPELDALVTTMPGRELRGVDLSPGMVRRARERGAAHAQVSVVEGDASTLEPQSAAAVVSVFGLQQLPEPDVALRSWAAALRPGGRLAVVFWPAVTEDDGPFAIASELVRRHVPPHDWSWQERLVPALTAQGLTVDRDEEPSYPISHPDAAEFFDAYTRSGPMRSLADARGAEFVAGLRREFLARAPQGRWEHRPHARLIVARAPVSSPPSGAGPR